MSLKEKESLTKNGGGGTGKTSASLTNWKTARGQECIEEGVVGEGAGEVGKSHSTSVKYFSFYPKDKEELLE